METNLLHVPQDGGAESDANLGYKPRKFWYNQRCGDLVVHLKERHKEHLEAPSQGRARVTSWDTLSQGTTQETSCGKSPERTVVTRNLIWKRRVLPPQSY